MNRFEFHLAGLESELVFRDHQCRVSPDQVTGFEVTAEISSLAIIADEKFNIGSSWYCVHDETGAIHRVSPEYGNGIEFVNSDSDRFMSCLRAAAEWSSAHDSVKVRDTPECVDKLAHAIVAIDNDAISTPAGQWATLIDHIRVSAADSDPEMEFWFKIT